MYARLERHWWVLPVLSGALLILTFHPFNLWPLGFIALTPLYFFAGGFDHSRWRIFWGGCIAGGLFAFFLSYYTIVQFHWLPETYLFVDAVRWLTVPITLLGGGICGLSLVLYNALRGRSHLLNAALAAALYTLAEIVLGGVFGGYYIGLLAYAAAPLTTLLSIAAIGGAHLVSFMVALVSGFLAETFIIIYTQRKSLRVLIRPLGLSAVLIFTICVPNWIYLHAPLSAERTLKISIVQVGPRESILFGTQKNGTFFWNEATVLTQVAALKPDLLIYPFSPVEGALYRTQAPAFNKEVLVASESSVAHFFKGLFPASTTLMTWNNVYTGGHFYNEYELWQDGNVVSEYQKRDLFPFMDYTPGWAQRLGLFSTPFDVVPGTPDNHLALDGVPLGSLMCSELHNTALARSEARSVPLIIAVGSEAMFEDDIASSFSLKAAQLRAAENDVPVVRGNILGPSGIIDRFGKLTASAPAGQSATISAEVTLTVSRATLYNMLGEWLIWVAMCGVLAGALWLKGSSSPAET